jgi:peptide/nickel transport system permease protein
VLLSALCASIVHEIEHDLIHNLYFKRRPAVQNALLGIGWLIGGLIVTESVFGYPGIGRLLLYAIQRRDLPLIQAVTMVVVAIYSLSNLIADIVYAYLNPRIRLN